MKIGKITKIQKNLSCKKTKCSLAADKTDRTCENMLQMLPTKAKSYCPLQYINGSSYGRCLRSCFPEFSIRMTAHTLAIHCPVSYTATDV